MNIFDYALEMEKEGEDFYSKIAKRSSQDKLREILKMLAKQEAKHYFTLIQMKNRKDHKDADSELIDINKSFFDDIDPDEDFDEEKKLADIYRQAKDIEKKSMDVYAELAEQSENPHHKEIFQILYNEEHTHYIFLENIVHLLS